jgi:hypothetical protein
MARKQIRHNRRSLCREKVIFDAPATQIAGVDRDRRSGQLKRRMWTFRTRPIAAKAVSVLEPP